MIVHAIVIKNFVPFSYKVQIIHEQYGKIMCMYPKDHQARLLTTGSIILCSVEATHRFYRLEYLEILTTAVAADLDQLQFMHDMIKVCLKLVPENVAVSDIFEFLLHVHQNMRNLTIQGRRVALLRLFMLCEVLPVTPELYHLAMQDPYAITSYPADMVDRFLKIGWHEITQEKETA